MLTQEMSTAEIQKFVDTHPELYHCVGMIAPARPGVRHCIVRFEYEIYPPNTPLNDNFYMFLITWQDIIWSMISFPKGDLDKLVTIATECGVEPKYNTPAVITAKGIGSFPIQSRNMFCFENTKDHPVYNNSQKTTAEILEYETLAIEEIFNGTKLRH